MIISILISSCNEIFDLGCSFSDCVTAEHTFFDNNTMLTDKKLMTVITDSEWLLAVKCACKWENKVCFELNLWVCKNWNLLCVSIYEVKTLIKKIHKVNVNKKIQNKYKQKKCKVNVNKKIQNEYKININKKINKTYFYFYFFHFCFLFYFFLIMFLIHYLTYHIKLSLWSTRLLWIVMRKASLCLSIW